MTPRRPSTTGTSAARSGCGPTRPSRTTRWRPPAGRRRLPRPDRATASCSSASCGSRRRSPDRRSPSRARRQLQGRGRPLPDTGLPRALRPGPGHRPRGLAGHGGLPHPAAGTAWLIWTPSSGGWVGSSAPATVRRTSAPTSATRRARPGGRSHLEARRPLGLRRVGGRRRSARARPAAQPSPAGRCRGRAYAGGARDGPPAAHLSSRWDGPPSWRSVARSSRSPSRSHSHR